MYCFDSLPDFSKHGDQIQNISWKGDGSLLVTTSKDRKIRIIDPRANSVAQVGIDVV